VDPNTTVDLTQYVNVDSLSWMFSPFFTSRWGVNKNFNLLVWLKSHILKIGVIFFIGFITRVLVNLYLDVNVFVDFMNYISILYYLNMSCIIVYINNMDFNINALKHISLSGITYDNLLNAIKRMIDGRGMMTMN
jgi:hypothetical protein